MSVFIFFFNDTATTEIYTLSLHDALPICSCRSRSPFRATWTRCGSSPGEELSTRERTSSSPRCKDDVRSRSEEHTSELQSRQYLVCRLLLEKKKKLRYY